MKRFMNAASYGFTIVELLVVIVIIGILTGLVLNTFNGIQDDSKYTVSRQHLNALSTAVTSARIGEDTHLGAITGNNCSECPCRDAGRLDNLPKTDPCWVNYLNVITTLETASGGKLTDLKNGDPWGSPYLFDENEKETAGVCRQDRIVAAGANRSYAFTAGEPSDGDNEQIYIDLYDPTEC